MAVWDEQKMHFMYRLQVTEKQLLIGLHMDQ